MASNLFAGDRDGRHPPRFIIRYEPIESLKPNLKNERKHSKKQIQQIRESIRVFGFIGVVVTDAEKNIICGHARVEAAKQLGHCEIPTICADHLTHIQLKALAIADNKLALNATWDETLLGDTFRELATLDLDFGIDVTGFETPEIDLLMVGATPKTDSADEVPAPQPGPAVTKPGDLWKLGSHYVHCASAMDESAYQVLLAGNLAAAVFTDPPYNVPIDGHASGLGAIRHREFAMASGEMDERAYIAFLARICSLLTCHSTDGSLHYICNDWRHLRELLNAGLSVYSEVKNICVWAKDSPCMGSFYRSQHEHVVVFKKGRAPHRNNITSECKGQRRSPGLPNRPN